MTPNEIQAIRERLAERLKSPAYRFLRIAMHDNDIKTLLSHIDAQQAEIERLRGAAHNAVFWMIAVEIELKEHGWIDRLEKFIAVRKELKKALSDKKEGV